MTRNVFVIGLNDFNREKLERLRGGGDIAFHGLIHPDLLNETDEFDIPAMLAEAEAALSAFDGSIDAIVGYMDFPVSTMLPLLCRRFGMPGVSLEALLKCEHKYWSRIVQREAIPEHVPKFTAFDPFDDDALSVVGRADLSFPFFVKPIKSSGSRLGFRIDSPEDFDAAIARLRENIALISEPFDFVLDQAALPDEVRAVTGRYCMAEQVIGGHQCTVEGYVHKGEVVSYGIVDSIRYPQVLSFFHYLYPSRLPPRVQSKMRELTEQVMSHTGYDDSAFNIEYFWDEISDRIWILEINTRISQSHCDLFEKVDGVSNQQVAVDLGLGRRPDMPSREGEYPCAAKFFYRVFFRDATVARIPSPEEFARAEAVAKGTVVQNQVSPGMRLSALPEQDSYSYAIAYVWMGARKESTLLWNYEHVIKALDYEFAEIEE